MSDAINVDMLLGGRAMEREEYTGESTERGVSTADASLHEWNGSLPLQSTLGSQPSQSSKRTRQLVDEDSPSLAAPVSGVEETMGTLHDRSASKPVQDYVYTLDVYSLHKLVL